MRLALCSNLSLVLVSLAPAQVVVTNSGNSAFHHVDVQSGTSTTLPPLNLGASGLAADDETGDLFITTRSLWSDLYRWRYGDPAGPQLVGRMIPPGHTGPGGGFLNGLAFGNGRLFVMSTTELSNSPAGVYEVDLATADVTLQFAMLDGRYRGLAYDALADVFYTADQVGREIVAIDAATGIVTTVLGSSYAGFPDELVELGYGEGRLYLVATALGAPGYVFDLGSNTFTGTFVNPVETGGFSAGCAFAPTITEEPFSNYCVANPNSSGAPAAMTFTGSQFLSANDLVLGAEGLPPFSFGFFLTSTTQAFVPNVVGSSGNLCLGGSIGRYVGSGQVQNSGAAGTLSLAVDLESLPQPNGFIGALPGDVWNFQAWFRDTTGTGATSNFTDGLRLRVR